MNFVRWSPFQDVTRLQRNFEGTRTWMPPADIYETEKELVINADLPGVDPARLAVSVENSVLIIRGERRFDEKPRVESFHRAERPLGTFARTFTLGTRVDADKIAARYQDGVLRISLPKSEAARAKQIQIAATA